MAGTDRKTPPMTIPKKVREALRERSSGDPQVGLCEICGQRANNAHHRRNKSQGGQDALTNLLMLCGSGSTGCHGMVTRGPEWAVHRGYTIKGTVRQPSEVAVLLHVDNPSRDPEWVLLGDDGSVVSIPEPAGGRVV